MQVRGNRSKAVGNRCQKLEIVVFLILVSCFFSFETNAQCAMCRAALESEESGVQAEAVNDGIVYLMAIPYLLVGIIGFAIYRLKYKKKK